MARIQILSAEEQKVFSTPPIFSYVEKEYFFTENFGKLKGMRFAS